MQPECELATENGPSGPLAEGELERAAELFRTHGSLVLPDSFDRTKIQELSALFTSDYAPMAPDVREQTCLKVGEGRFMFTVDIDGPFAEPDIYASPIVLPIVRALLGDKAILQSFGAVCAFPNAPAQHVHRDFPELFPSVAGLGMMLPPYALHVVIPLTDLTPATGTTAIWQGSHRVAHRDRGRDAVQVDNTVDLTDASLPYLRMGDCYFMDYRLRHAGTPNASNLPRTILYLVYSRPWFKDRSNHTMQAPLSIDDDTLGRVPREHAPLFGALRNG